MVYSPKELSAFQALIKKYYQRQGRRLPWREPAGDGQFDPYQILVSEVMLQQTQVNRVLPKYQEFLDAFPTLATLANSSLSEVLRVWSGLGYNRRAKYLWQAAQVIQADSHGRFPDNLQALTALPGIGYNTAAAVLVYAFNQPVAFVETNIRTVYIHHFFADAADVPDSAILKHVERTLDREKPREFYWGLMDHGTYLKSTVGNLSTRSKHYAKQSRFAGSKRQLRGAVLKLLVVRPHSKAELSTTLPDGRLELVLNELVTEQLIAQEDDYYSLR